MQPVSRVQICHERVERESQREEEAATLWRKVSLIMLQ